MRLYAAVRDWVDRRWGGNHRALGLPAVLPVLPLVWIRDGAATALALIWLALWSGFIMWRGFLYMRRVTAEMKGEPYDRHGKYRLSKEYWGTESVAAARYRERKSKAGGKASPSVAESGS